MKKITIKIISFLAFSLLLISSVQASEVTGTLSSGVQGSNAISGVINGSVGGGGSQVNGTLTNGSVGGGSTISGTVTGGNSGGGGGGSGGGGGGSGFPFNPSTGLPLVLGASANNGNTYTPSVLGASTSPSFPTTGFPAREESIPWIAIVAFATTILLSNLLIGELRKKTI